MLIDRPTKAVSTAEADLRDVEAIGKITAAPILLQVLCEATEMGFALKASDLGSTALEQGLADDATDSLDLRRGSAAR
jgi:hypothetical protein